MAVDLVFEVIRSRSLAIVELIALFLLINAQYFDTEMCKPTFALHPSTVGMRSLADWPADLPTKIGTMRTNDDDVHHGFVILFTLRFVFCNIANNRWVKEETNNLTGVAFFVAMFFSFWSLTVTINDATYCHYPCVIVLLSLLL